MRIAEALSLKDVVSREDFLDLLSHAYEIFGAETDIQHSRDMQETAALLKRGFKLRTGCFMNQMRVPVSCSMARIAILLGAK